jgi:hypothetical protein
MKHETKLYNLSLIFLVITVIFFSGCGYRAKKAINKEMQSWVGRHQSELITSWGQPNNTDIDGQGGTILIYSQFVDLGYDPGHPSDPFGRYSFKAPRQKGYYKMRMFFINPDGYIYNYKWEGR